MVSLAGLVALVAPAAQAQDCFAFATYYPVEPGQRWEYHVLPGDRTETLRVLPDATVINGRATVAIAGTGGVTTFRSDLDGGLALHRRVVAQGAARVVTTYDPPIVRSGAEACVGDSRDSAGAVAIDAPGVGIVDVRYTASAAVEAVEAVRVPAGEFEALRLRWVTGLRGNIDGRRVDEVVSEVNWFAPGVGLVRSEATTDNGTVTLALIDTDRGTAPPPPVDPAPPPPVDAAPPGARAAGALVPILQQLLE